MGCNPCAAQTATTAPWVTPHGGRANNGVRSDIPENHRLQIQFL